MFDIVDGHLHGEAANFLAQAGSIFFCPGMDPGAIMTVPCLDETGVISPIFTFDHWLNELGFNEQTTGEGVDLRDGWQPVIDRDEFELQIRTEYEFLIWKLIIKDDGQHEISDILSAWARGVGNAVNFWSGGGNNPNVVDPYDKGPEVRIPLPPATPGPYPG